MPGRLLETFRVSSTGVDEKSSLFASSSGVFGETDEKSAIVAKEPAGLDTKTVLSSFELGFCA